LSKDSWAAEEALVARLRLGDGAAFAALVDGLHSRLVALAGTFTSSPALAEDIVQETWLAVIRGLRGFEGRCTLRTWIFSILVRRARTLATREKRRAEIPRSQSGSEPDAPSVEWEPGRGAWGLWEKSPVTWGLEDPESVFLRQEALEVVQKAVAELPPMQRQVILLRDVEDLEAERICSILEISETNQRVLLHRGRARVRRALDHYLRGGAKAPSRTGSPRAPGVSTDRSSDPSVHVSGEES